MNKVAIILMIAIIATSVMAHKNGHKCMHDQISDKIEREITDYILNEESERNLQTSQPRKMKITYDISYYNNLPKTPEMKIFKKSCEKAIKIAIKFFNNLITITPKPAGSMKWDLRSKTCGAATIPTTDKTVDKDSDLHLYITYTNEPKESYLAYAGWCRFLRTIGPTHGQVNFNLGILNSYNFANTLQFEDLVEIVTHEMLHVLGFSGYDIANWIDASKKPHVNPTVVQTTRGLPTTYIRTPNVLAAAKKYYGCESIPGMPVENQGGQGSNGSHWDTTAIMDELMNAAISNTQAIFTRFTAALLRDTGFYYSINEAMEEQSYYGKDEGCAFLTGTCDTNKREFCAVGTKTQKCDYYSHGVGQCNASVFDDSGCNNYSAYGNSRCFDEKNNFQNNPTYKKYMGVGFGINSKCFDSSLISQSARQTIEEQGMCYNFECNAAKQVIITVGTTKVLCSKNGEKVKVAGYVGLLTCPEKLDEFCGYKKQCTNQCSSNGFCNNGMCLCADGFTGASCEKSI